jgi:transposase
VSWVTDHQLLLQFADVETGASQQRFHFSDERVPVPVRPECVVRIRRKTRARFLEFCRYLRSLYPPSVRIAIICGNFAPHLTTKKDKRVGTWAAASNTEIAYTPTNSSWLNRIEAQFTALRYFALDGTGHATHEEQASMIRRYIIWRNNHAYDERLRRVVTRVNVA